MDSTKGDESLTQESTSDMAGECVVIKQCEACLQDNTSVEATLFCSSCTEFLCDECKSGHIRYKRGKHEFINAIDSQIKYITVDLKGIDACEEHKKKVKFFCKDHSLLCCSTCAFSHRKCENINELVKISGDSGQELQNLKDKLSNAADYERSKIEDCKQTVTAIYDKLSNLKDELHKTKEDITNIFDVTIALINKEAKSTVDIESKRLGERRSASEAVFQGIVEILSLCSDVIDNGTPQQAFILTRCLEKKLQEIDIHVKEQRVNHFSLDLSLDLSTELTNILQNRSDAVKLVVKKCDQIKDEISESSGDLQNDCTVSVYNTLKSSDVSFSGENSLKSTDVSPAVENTLNSTDVSPSVDNRLKSADVSPSVDKILKSTYVSPSVGNRLKNTDVSPSVENNLKSTDVSLIQLVQDSNTASSNLKLEPIIDVQFAVSGIDFMSDGRLVTVYKNKQCILMNDKLVKIGKTYLLRAIPVGVVCMSDNEIAVALTNKTICVLVVEKDCVIREKRTFITNVQYLALRKLDDSTLVGFTRDIPEHARKITMDGREEDFKTLKKINYSRLCPGYYCQCVFIPSRNTFLTMETNNKLHIHDTDTGSNKDMQFEKEIYAVCQGLEGSAMVVCKSEVVQMTMKGVILRKCNRSGYALMVCANKSFSTLAIASFDTIKLYSSTATTTWSLEPRAELAFTINGLDFLPDGRLVAVFANRTCVIMDDKLNKIGKMFVFKASPHDVVCMSDNEIAVACNNMTICVLSVRQDGVIQEKCSFKTQLQYCALRKFDTAVMIGFAVEIARKITFDGVEQEFKAFIKHGYSGTLSAYKCKYACIPCINKLATFDKETNVVYLQDPDKGTSKCVHIAEEICALCQGPAGTVFVVCKGEFVQMSCEGRTLNKCSFTGFEDNVCANKDFSVIALSNITTVRLYKLSI
ncbi:uncharacterized protein LOC127836235 isoform X2 [Dreissena polymorpha]|uniref:uncharacterized protein LOC127836235 isoform X2 n=1 Tax=Dreissena polymorpha TaxID=45954 RepID=UPI002264603D|nr:uncharacterized protein LOC127836235 isoform X2 [Dreissena polymorpha]